MSEMIRSFDALGSGGRRVTAEVWRVPVHRLVRGGGSRVSDLMLFETSDGDELEPAGPGRFRVRRTGEVLRTADGV